MNNDTAHMHQRRRADRATVLKALLNDVVAKHVLHQADGVWLHLLIHCHYVLCCCTCQLLLYEAAAVLIPAEVVHKALDVLYGQCV